MNRLDEIRKVHEATLIMDWRKEFESEFQPDTLSDAERCHLRRAGELLEAVSALFQQCHLHRGELLDYADRAYKRGLRHGLQTQDKQIAELEEQLEQAGFCSDCFRPHPACNCSSEEGE